MGLHDKGKQTAQNHQHWQSLSLTKLTSPTPLYILNFCRLFQVQTETELVMITRDRTPADTASDPTFTLAQVFTYNLAFPGEY